MALNSQTDSTADLQVGPTDRGMVRIYIRGDAVDLPLDFTPEEAREIAAELVRSAETARGSKRKPRARAPKGPANRRRDKG